MEGGIQIGDHHEAGRRRRDGDDLQLFEGVGGQPDQFVGFKRPDGHENPPMAIHGRTFQIPQGKLVAFDLDTPVLDRIEGDKEYSLSPDKSAAIKAAYTGTKPLSVVDGKIYLGADTTRPALGDYRIGYELAPLGVVSIVARQAGSRFEPYQTEAGDALLMVDTGAVPADKMFAEAVSANTLITWLLRAAGLLLLTIGFALFLSPIGVILDVIPFLGSMARMGTGIIAFFLSILVGTTTIAIAWFWYRPFLAAGILAAGVVLRRRSIISPLTHATARRWPHRALVLPPSWKRGGACAPVASYLSSKPVSTPTALMPISSTA